MTENDIKIKKRLEKIQAYYNLGDLLRHETSQEDVAKYYRHSDFFYNIIHSGGGHNIHMALSDDGKFRRKDFQQQSKFVAKHITNDVGRILEIGAGKVVNTKHLARWLPDKNFTALDIPNRNFLKTKVPSNVSLVEGDYHDLSIFEPCTFDLVFAVETICHSDDKEKVVKQISRILKPNGKLIIFDVYEPLPRHKMSDFQKHISAVTLAGMRVTSKDHYIGDMKKYLKRNNFSNIIISNLTKKIRPNLKRLERISAIYYNHPRFAELLRQHISEDVTINSIAGYLMFFTFDGKTIHQYNRIIATKSLL